MKALETLKLMPEKPAARSEFHQVTDTTIVTLAHEFRVSKELAEMAESRLVAARAELLPRITEEFFRVNRGKTTPTEQLRADGVVISFARVAYPVPDVASCHALRPFLRERLTVTLDFDKIPSDQQEVIAQQLLAVAPSAIKVTKKFVPTEEFWAARHSRLSVAENLDAERVLKTRVALR